MTFLGDYLAGRAEPEGIHDHIDDWHEGTDGQSLRVYLGMSWEQYASWVERSELPERPVLRAEIVRGDQSVVPGA